MSSVRALRVWDLPTRLFHWSLVLLFALLWFTGEKGEAFVAAMGVLGVRVDDAMNWHVGCGYGVLGLLLFRLLWGFLGSDTARFGYFLRSPLTAARYLVRVLRGGNGDAPGHNPAGGWMVVILLAGLLVQVGSGLFAYDDYGFEGPLAHLVGEQLGQGLLALHRANVNVLLSLVGLHLAAIAFYALVKRDNLIRPMLSGRKVFPGDQVEPRMASPWLALACALAAGGVAWWLVG